VGFLFHALATLKAQFCF